MNDINNRQNSETCLQKLSAQRRAYSESKWIFYVRSISAVTIAITFPILTEWKPGLKNWLIALAVVFVVIDVYLKKLESEKRVDGAKIQEAFDTDLYSLEWNYIAAGSRPDNETIGRYFEKVRDRGFDGLTDWYPNNLSALPLSVARTVCQRANIWWDSGLRRLYANLNLVLLILILGIVIWVNKDKTVANSFVVFASFFSLFKLLLEEYISHQESAKRLTQIKEHLDNLLEDAITKHDVEGGFTRSVQDELFRHRSLVTSIPNWFYYLFKKRYEGLMCFGAKKYLERYSASDT